MKKLVIFTLFFCAGSSLFAYYVNGALTNHLPHPVIEQIDEEYVKSLSYRTFLEKYIPARFVDYFYDYTVDNMEIGFEILSIGLYESEWVVLRGHQANYDGSIDLGPLMLNSNNLSNERFMNAYAPRITPNDLYAFYMIVCINYWKDLRKTFSGNSKLVSALQVYNGGYLSLYSQRYKSRYLVTFRYANKITNILSSVKGAYEEHCRTFKPMLRKLLYSEKQNDFRAQIVVRQEQIWAIEDNLVAISIRQLMAEWNNVFYWPTSRFIAELNQEKLWDKRRFVWLIAIDIDDNFVKASLANLLDKIKAAALTLEDYEIKPQDLLLI
jgi:hypothetical protein